MSTLNCPSITLIFRVAHMPSYRTSLWARGSILVLSTLNSQIQAPCPQTMIMMVVVIEEEEEEEEGEEETQAHAENFLFRVWDLGFRAEKN